MNALRIGLMLAAFAIGSTIARPDGVDCKQYETSFWCPSGLTSARAYYLCALPFFEGEGLCAPGTICNGAPDGTKTSLNPCGTCTVTTSCQAANVTCGTIFDGCRTLSCGPDCCVPTTSCDQAGKTCGTLWDGCKTLTCGPACCVPSTSCDQEGQTCGTLWDGCQSLTCGPACCVPTTSCDQESKACGTLWDGCKTLTCGPACCVPTTSCFQEGQTCGTLFNGCANEACGIPCQEVDPEGDEIPVVNYCKQSMCGSRIDCRCCDESLPGNLSLASAPQFVLVTIDDDLEERFWPLIWGAVGGARSDPSGCPPRPTFFLNNEFSDAVTMTKALQAGCELGCHTFHHRASDTMTKEEWAQEIESGRLATARAVGMSEAEAHTKILGFRAPNLLWNRKTLEALQGLGMLYDNSVGERRKTQDLGEWIWPCTFDFPMPRMGGAFEGRANGGIRGLWEIPMHVFDDALGNPYAVMDPPGTAAENLAMLKRTLDAHHSGRKAPMGVWLHAAWLLADEARVQTLADFLSYCQSAYSDVYFVTGSQLIKFMRKPVPASALVSSPLCSLNA